VTRDHGICLSLERAHSIQPVQVGMIDEQPGLQRIEAGAIGLPPSNGAIDMSRRMLDWVIGQPCGRF
jgi:hypothetical protein